TPRARPAPPFPFTSLHRVEFRSMARSADLHGAPGRRAAAHRAHRHHPDFRPAPRPAPWRPTRMPPPTSTPPTTTCADGASAIAGSTHAMIVAPIGSPSVARFATYAGM